MHHTDTHIYRKKLDTLSNLLVISPHLYLHTHILLLDSHAYLNVHIYYYSFIHWRYPLTCYLYFTHLYLHIHRLPLHSHALILFSRLYMVILWSYTVVFSLYILHSINTFTFKYWSHAVTSALYIYINFIPANHILVLHSRPLSTSHTCTSCIQTLAQLR